MQTLLLVSQIVCPDPINLRGEDFYHDDGPIIKVRNRKPKNIWDRLAIFAGFAPDYEIVGGFLAFQRHKAAGHIRVLVNLVEEE